MANLQRIAARDEHGTLRVVVEAPRGSGAKLRYEPELEAFVFQRVLNELRYPYDWGFVPGTRAPDGDPLDALVIHALSTWPGVIIPVSAIGVLRLRDGRGVPRQDNHRLICAPVAARAPLSLADLGGPERRDLAEFFAAVGRLAGKEVEVLGWAGPEEAERVLAEAVGAHESAIG